jgi:hypothetical protein
MHSSESKNGGRGPILFAKLWQSRRFEISRIAADAPDPHHCGHPYEIGRRVPVVNTVQGGASGGFPTVPYAGGALDQQIH